MDLGLGRIVHAGGSGWRDNGNKMGVRSPEKSMYKKKKTQPILRYTNKKMRCEESRGHQWDERNQDSYAPASWEPEERKSSKEAEVIHGVKFSRGVKEDNEEGTSIELDN